MFNFTIKKTGMLHAVIFLSLFPFTQSFSQLTRTWEYSFSPPANLEAAGNCIVHLPQGLTIAGGIYKNSANFYTKNILLFTDDAGSLIKADTSVIGFGFTKIIYGGSSSYFAMAALQNDSNAARNILLAKIDSASLNVSYFVPDSSPTIYYDPADLVLLNNGRLVVGSRMDNFPLLRLSLTCMDNAGNLIWQTVDSSFEIKYDLELIADQSGGFYASGTGRDLLTSEDFIFISHFDSNGQRDWFQRQGSQSTSFADFLDLDLDVSGHLWMSGVLMDSSGQVGTLMKYDTLGNLFWKHTVSPHPYLKIISDENNFIYGAAVPSNGLDVFTIDKLDSSGSFLYSTNFQLSGYFNSILHDFRLLEDGIIAATGDLYVLSFPKSDLYLAIYDTALNLVDHNIFNSANFLGESGRAVVQGDENEVFVCGRLFYENQFETCNMGVIRYGLQIFDGIGEVDRDNNFQIFPNPASGKITVRCNDFSGDQIHLTIYNSIGDCIVDRLFFGNCSETYLDLNLPDGLYVLQLKSGSIGAEKKLLVVNR